MAMTRRMFAQLVASALLLRHLPALAQTPLTVAVGGSPGPNITQRVVSAGAPADMLLLAVAPEKVVGFPPLISLARPPSRFTMIFGVYRNWAGWRAAPARSRLKHSALKPDLVIDCGNADETRLSQARQVSAQTHIPRLLINGELRHTPEQLHAAGEALGVVSRTAMQAALARRFIDNAIAFSHTAAANLRFMPRAVPEDWRQVYKVLCIPKRQNCWGYRMWRTSRTTGAHTGFNGKSAQLAARYYFGAGYDDSAAPTRRSDLARSQSSCGPAHSVSQRSAVWLVGCTSASTAYWDYAACTPGLIRRLTRALKPICSATANCSGIPR